MVHRPHLRKQREEDTEGYGTPNFDPHFIRLFLWKLARALSAVAVILIVLLLPKYYPDYGELIGTFLAITAILYIIGGLWHEDAEAKNYFFLGGVLFHKFGRWHHAVIAGTFDDEENEVILSRLPEGLRDLHWKIAHFTYKKPEFKMPRSPLGFKDEYLLLPKPRGEYISNVPVKVATGSWVFTQKGGYINRFKLEEIFNGTGVPRSLITIPCASDGEASFLQELVDEKAEIVKDGLVKMGFNTDALDKTKDSILVGQIIGGMRDVFSLKLHAAEERISEEHNNYVDEHNLRIEEKQNIDARLGKRTRLWRAGEKSPGLRYRLGKFGFRRFLVVMVVLVALLYLANLMRIGH